MAGSSHRLGVIINALAITFILGEINITPCYGLRLILLGKQLRAARVLLGWSQIELAQASGVAIGTIRRMESFDGEIVSYTSTLSKVQDAMEAAGIEFLNSKVPGVRLHARGKA